MSTALDDGIADTTEVTSATTVRNVIRIDRRGVGRVYRAVVSLYALWDFLRRSVILYAPKYQRGYSDRLVDLDAEWYDENKLFPIDSKELQIKEERANEIAVKYLKGMLYNPSITWNARQEPGADEPEYNREAKTLNIHGPITIPDSGHRHRAFFNLVLWKRDPNKVPERGILVNQETVSKEEILRLLDTFDPKTEYVYVDVFTVTAKQEGYLYDEYNSDAKPPSTAVAIDLNPEKTPSRRFVYRVMDTSQRGLGMLARDQVETRRNSVARKSRKLVTNATLEASVREFSKELNRLEREDPKLHEDLVNFYVAFFEEFGRHYPEWSPDEKMVSADIRWALRERSFALSNIIFFPLSRIAFDLWQRYRKEGTSWRTEKVWRAALAKIAGETKVTDKDGNVIWEGEVLSRKNPEWIGKIIIRVFDASGNYSDSLSSTRQTRQAMEQYLRRVAGL